MKSSYKFPFRQNYSIITSAFYSKQRKIFSLKEIPNPNQGYSSTIFNNFSTEIMDICENVIEIKAVKEIDHCFNFFMDISNLILWNSFIYQILEYRDQTHYLLHCFFHFDQIIPLESVVPIKIIYYIQNEVIEFQNCTSFGMPFCSRIFFINNDKNTKINIYIRYPLPKSIKKNKISSESYALMVQEILNSNCNTLLNMLERE